MRHDLPGKLPLILWGIVAVLATILAIPEFKESVFSPLVIAYILLAPLSWIPFFLTLRAFRRGKKSACSRMPFGKELREEI